MTVRLDGPGVSNADVAAVARGHEPVDFTDAAMARMHASREIVERLDPVEDEVVRAMMFLRARILPLGNSGARRLVAQAMAAPQREGNHLTRSRLSRAKTTASGSALAAGRRLRPTARGRPGTSGGSTETSNSG